MAADMHGGQLPDDIYERWKYCRDHNLHNRRHLHIPAAWRDDKSRPHIHRLGHGKQLHDGRNFLHQSRKRRNLSRMLDSLHCLRRGDQWNMCYVCRGQRLCIYHIV